MIIRRDSPSSCRSFLGTPTVEWLFDRSLTSYLLPSERTMSLIINNDTVQGGKGLPTCLHLLKHRKIERFSTFNSSLTLIIVSLFARRNSSQQVSQVATRDHFHDSFSLLFSLFFFPFFLPRSINARLRCCLARGITSVILIPRG